MRVIICGELPSQIVRHALREALRKHVAQPKLRSQAQFARKVSHMFQFGEGGFEWPRDVKKFYVRERAHRGWAQAFTGKPQFIIENDQSGRAIEYRIGRGRLIVARLWSL